MKTIIFFTLLILSSCDIGGHSCEDEEDFYYIDNTIQDKIIKWYSYVDGTIFNQAEIPYAPKHFICTCGDRCSSLQNRANNFSAPLSADSVVFILGSRYINFVSPRIDEVKYNEQKQASYFNPDNWIYAYEFQLNEELFEVWGEER